VNPSLYHHPEKRKKPKGISECLWGKGKSDDLIEDFAVGGGEEEERNRLRRPPLPIKKRGGGEKKNKSWAYFSRPSRGGRKKKRRCYFLSRARPRTKEKKGVRGMKEKKRRL